MTNPDAHLQCLLQDRSMLNKRSDPRESTQMRSGYRNENFGVKFDKRNMFNSYQVAYEKFYEYDANQNFPDEIIAVAYHRRFIKKSYYFYFY